MPQAEPDAAENGILDGHAAERPHPRVAVVIPCLNEEAAIGPVVAGFRAALPDAFIVVVDNRSTDRTADEARAAGAIVQHETRKGKGYALQSAIGEIDADVYVFVDGDATYPVEEVHRLIEPITRHEADMVVGERLGGATSSTLTPLHSLGNRLIVSIVNLFFGSALHDVLSGYRALSRRMVDSVPLVSPGFEVETELTIKALEQGFSIAEIPIAYRPRPTGSVSKLRTFRDGYRILITIAILLRDHHPLLFFSLLSGTFFAAGVALGVVAPTRAGSQSSQGWEIFVSIGLVLVAAIVASGGLILNAVNTRVRELQSVVLRLSRRR
ncbi:MAG: glycosyltransferase [Acidobacteria bacterium]|nr:glycosyltransferase [Acidobacteriota bacterium]